MIDDNEIYVIVDIEADGPVPGLHSMLSIGAVASTETEEVSHFYKKLQPIEGASQFPFTMKWWSTQPTAWIEVTADAEPAQDVMQELDTWIHSLGHKPIFVAHPTGFDYAFVSWYFWKFLNRNPFGTQAGGGRTLDLQSYTAGRLNITLSDAHRSKLPNKLTENVVEHTHKAIDDARGYGAILRNLLQA